MLSKLKSKQIYVEKSARRLLVSEATRAVKMMLLFVVMKIKDAIQAEGNESNL